jgi:hypothetical protein
MFEGQVPGNIWIPHASKVDRGADLPIILAGWSVCRSLNQYLVALRILPFCESYVICVPRQKMMVNPWGMEASDVFFTTFRHVLGVEAGVLKIVCGVDRLLRRTGLSNK